MPGQRNNVDSDTIIVPSAEPPHYSQREIIAFLEKANHIASMTSLEDLLEQMLELMIEVSSATNGTLYLLDRDAGELIFKVVKGDPDSQHLVGMRMKQSMGIVGAAVQRARPIVIEDLSSDPRWYRELNPDLAARLRNAITLPLLLQGTPIGAVQIFNFVYAELELLQQLGNRMASEVDKILMLEKAQRSNRRLQFLVDLLGRVGATLDREELLRLVTEQATLLLEAEKSSIFLANTNDNGQSMLSVSNTGVSQGVPDHSFMAKSAVAVPLRTRPISVGKERSVREERIIGNLMVINKQVGAFDAEDTQLLEILASQASTVLQVAELYKDANEMFIDFISTLAATIDAKDPYTRGHSQRVSDLSVTIARHMNFNADMIHDIRIGSLLHDFGKILIADAILTKPSRLTNEEYEQMKKHPGIGYKIIREVHLLQNTLPAIVEHHERLDGSGYPLGLRGEQISLIGRIVAVADVFDALSTDRPYRDGWDIETVFDYLERNTSVLFDGDCVQALLTAYQNDPEASEMIQNQIALARKQSRAAGSAASEAAPSQ